MKTFTLITLAVAALAAGALAAGYVTIETPKAGDVLEGGKVVNITWHNATTTPADVYVLRENRRTTLVTDDGASDGLAMWRVPQDGGVYTIVVEASNGAKATLEVTVGGAPALPKVYPTPNPLDLSKGDASLVFSGAPAGSQATIFDMEGREVTKVTGDPLSWDGRNARGDVVAGGTYMYVVETGGGERFTGKIAVVK